jgi:chromosome partitioning protein
MLLVLANEKGGVGKSTLAVHLAVWAYEQGFKVALLDTDKQRSALQWTSEAEPQVTISYAGLPSDARLEAQRLHQSNDFVLVDTPGLLGRESRALVLLADLVVFPVLPSILDLRSLARATEALRYAQSINDGRPDARVVLNCVDRRTAVAREFRLAASRLGLEVAQTPIRRLSAFVDAAQQGTVVTRMGYRAAKAKRDITALSAELTGMRLKDRLQPPASSMPSEAVNA